MQGNIKVAMLKLTFLGALGEVGRSGALLSTSTETLLLDYGTKISQTPPLFPVPIETKVSATLLSHAHLDHSGALPLVDAPIYALSVSRPLVRLLLLDSIKIAREEMVRLPFARNDVNKTIDRFVEVGYGKEFRIGQTSVTFYPAGHIPGSALILIESQGKKVLYTGDFNDMDTRLLKGMNFEIEGVDALIMESTYSEREHPPRESQERELVRIIEDTLALDGKALIAGFAVGRLQEILLVLHAHGIWYPVYVDGMAKKVITILNQHKRFLKEPECLESALEKVEYVARESKRRRIVRRACVILTTSGFLSGGPVVSYLKRLHRDRNSSLILVGWQIEGTPGRTLLETGKYLTQDLSLDVRMFIRRLDFSSHVGRSGLFEFVKKVNPRRVFCVHGDHTDEFARELREMGFDALAPSISQRAFLLSP
jgi:putative mRNA 3-end processing factor